MRYHYTKKLLSSVCAVALTVTLSQSMVAEELDTEIPSAGAAVVINNYITNTGSGADIAALLPKEAPAKTVTPVSTGTKKDNKSDSKSTVTNKDKADKYFEDIAIARVYGGEEGYVNVRKKPNVDSKRVGKIYNNCGARILETTSNGWYKIVSGHCTGYIKAEYFVVGKEAKESALDNGYVFANIKDTGIRVRKQPSTEAEIVKNVYHNENYAIKSFSKDGNWIKIKIKGVGSGWIAEQFAKVSINMDTAITLKEEREMIRRQREEEERQRQQAAAAQNNNTDTNTNTDTGSSSSSNNYSYGDSGSASSGGAAIVAYAKQFLGNPYVYGGSSLTHGTDCSGFTMSVYAHFGYGLNRSSYTQVYNGRAVSMSELQAGDLLFYRYGGGTISHVAIYIGGGSIIHASTESTGIIISGMGSPCAARRIL